jgi:hypothetical protein
MASAKGISEGHPDADTDADYRLPFPGVVAHHLSDFQG